METNVLLLISADELALRRDKASVIKVLTHFDLNISIWIAEL